MFRITSAESRKVAVMNKLLVFAILCFAALLFLPGCGASTGPTTSIFSTALTSPASLPPEPVEVVSVSGPYPDYVDGKPLWNPGGPKIEITLINDSPVPIVSLTAALGIVRAGPVLPFTFSFNVSSAAPLQPGKSVSSRQILIGGGFSSGSSYPLSISGTVLDGREFSFTKQVNITAPAQ